MMRFVVLRHSWRCVAWLGVIVLLCLPTCGCSFGPGTPPGGRKSPTQSGQKVDIEKLRPAVAAFCGDCHAVPPASSFAKAQWEKEVQQGYEFYWNSGRSDLVEPPVREVVAFFEAQAPAELDYPAAAYSDHPLPVRLRRQDLSLPSDKLEAGVSSIVWQPPAELSPGRLLFTEMRHGDVAAVRLGSELALQPMSHVSNAAAVQLADLDSDGRTDYLVSDLGSFPPQDHERGRLIWLRADGLRGYESHVLLRGLGRVANAAAGDFDGDKDVDVVVAEFGWRRTGKIHLLRRSGDEGGLPQFEDEIIDKRHGASHLLALDWDADGDLDFVALISQEHEKVDLFLNEGDGKFRIETVYSAGDPAFGSSGIELVDLDADGDRDVLFTNGDSLDSMTPKPYHGVRWLENRGGFPFPEHLLAPLPGAYKAVPADFDGDGDVDVAAVAFPGEGAALHSEESPSADSKFDILLILEQTEPGRFVRHRLEAAGEGLSLAAADFDGDGDVDLASGNFTRNAKNVWLTIWWNEGPASKSPPAAGNILRQDRSSASESN